MREFSRCNIVLTVIALLATLSVLHGVVQAAPLALTATETSVPILPIVTSTPDANGAVVHAVGYGQTLFTIAEAYGISIADLKAMNGLQTDEIYPGDKLTIRIGATPTVTGTPTRTASPTHRPTTTAKAPTATRRAPTQELAQGSTPTPTQAPGSGLLAGTLQIDRKTLGIGIILVCAVGLLIVGLTGFRKH